MDSNTPLGTISAGPAIGPAFSEAINTQAWLYSFNKAITS